MRAALKGLLAGGLVALGAGVGAWAQDAVPPVALPEAVEETTLVRDAFSTGLLTRPEGALASDLWRGANVGRLNYLLSVTPARLPGPALGDALRRVLLSPGDAPEGAGPALGGRKLLALARAGFTEEARTIASLSSAPRNEPYVAEALATADLLSGEVNRACARNAALSSGRDAEFWVKLRILCYVAAGERDAADLTLGLLRESGTLGQTDQALLSALVTGLAPKTPPAPETALHLAAMRQLGLPIAPNLLENAHAGVLKALARDASADVAARLTAANMAAAMGLFSRAELAGVYDSIEGDPEDLGRVSEIAAARPDDPYTDVIMYQSVRQMTAPEFLRDKAARIARAISAADEFSRMAALSLLYADEIEAMEGALLPPREAAAFAAARLSVGDGDGAARWLFAMLGSGGAASLEEAEVMELIELVNYLAILDPISASAVAEAAGVAVSDPRTDGAPPPAPGDERFRRRVVESAFDAAIADIPGQAVLAALAMSKAAAGDPLADVVIDQSLRAGGLNDLRRRAEFDSAWRARFARDTAPAQMAPAAAPDGPPAASEEEAGLTPRLKPDKNG